MFPEYEDQSAEASHQHTTDPTFNMTAFTSKSSDISDSSSVAPVTRRRGRGAAAKDDAAPATRGRKAQQQQQQQPPPLSPSEEPTGKGRGRRGAPKKAPELAGEDEESLYNMLLSGKHSLQVYLRDFRNAL